MLSALVHRVQRQFPGRPVLKMYLRTNVQLLRNGEQVPERNLLPPEDTFLSCTDTVQRLHRIFLEAALFLLCAAGSLQEHVCRVYPAFSSPFCSVFAELSAKNHWERNPVLFEDFHCIRDCLSAALRECDTAFAFCSSDLDGRTIFVESDLDWDLYQFFCHFTAESYFLYLDIHGCLWSGRGDKNTEFLV